MVEHCRANAEATGSNPVEAPKSFFFFRLISQLLKLRYDCDDHIFIPFVFPQFTIHFYSMFHSLHGVDELNKLACLSLYHCMGLYSSDGRALQRECKGHGFESC